MFSLPPEPFWVVALPANREGPYAPGMLGPIFWNSSKCYKLSVAILAQAIWVTNRASGARGTMWVVRRMLGKRAQDMPELEDTEFTNLLGEKSGAEDGDAPDRLLGCYPIGATVELRSGQRILRHDLKCRSGNARVRCHDRRSQS